MGRRNDLQYRVVWHERGARSSRLVLRCRRLIVGRRRGRWPSSSETVIAFILPAHIVVALLALVGVVSAWTVRAAPSLRTDTTSADRLPSGFGRWSHPASLLRRHRGLGRGHGSWSRGGRRPSSIPFNATWRESVAITMLGAGAFFAIVIAWFLVERGRPIHADLYFGTVALVVVGAIAWGALLGDFTTFYLFFAGIAVIATPVAAVAVWTVWERLRATRHLGLASGSLSCASSSSSWVLRRGAGRLITFGPPGYEPIPVTVLAAIGQLPPMRSWPTAVVGWTRSDRASPGSSASMPTPAAESCPCASWPRS